MVKIESSIGELLDKISILKIKKKKISSESKLINIENELDSLSEIANKFMEVDPLAFENFMKELVEVNSNLWETEDKIRVMEKTKNFNEDFIQLARSVYFTNDKRFEIKSKINNFYESEIVEEKQYEDYS
tara:strand:+ start:45 stop:434 length:390 start_codon:yes stop_codon:yes gene_type:complete